MNVPEKQAEATWLPFAECVDDACGWSVPESRVARDRAKSHVRATGHSVRVVVQRVAVWAPRVGVSS